MRFLGRLLAITLAILVIAAVPWAIWATGTDLLFSDADIYLDTLNRQNLYTELIPALLPAIAQESAEAEIEDPQALTFLNIVRNLEGRDWRRIASELTPADWLQSQVEENTRALFDWLHGRRPDLELAFDTASLRERLSGAPGQRAVNLILDSWPPCTEAELTALLNAETATQSAVPFCQPPGEYLAFTSEALTDVLRQQARTIPDVIPAPNWQENPKTRTQLLELQAGFRFLQVLVIEFWLLPLALLCLIVVFTIRSLKAFTRWNGTILALSGLAALLPLPLVLSPVLIAPAVGAALEPRPEAIAAGLGDTPRYAEFVLNDIFRALTGQITLPILVMSALVVGGGFVLLIISAIMRDPEPARPNQYPTPQISEAADSFAASGISKQ